MSDFPHDHRRGVRSDGGRVRYAKPGDERSLRPGTRVHLAERLGLSTMPVREALVCNLDGCLTHYVAYDESVAWGDRPDSELAIAASHFEPGMSRAGNRRNTCSWSAAMF
jgi:hypothetical protein